MKKYNKILFKLNLNKKKTVNTKYSLDEKVVQVQRVTKVMKGGKKLSFRAVIILGNEKGRVGVGVGKANEVSGSIKKAKHNARKNLINIPLTKEKSISHIISGTSGSAKVFIKPAGPGTGVIAGSSIRVVLELSGIQNILAKQLGSKNILNNARATIEALKSLNTPQTIANKRNISLRKIYQFYRIKKYFKQCSSNN